MSEDEHTMGTSDEVPWCMLFIDIIDETREGVNHKLEQWRHTKEANMLGCVG